MPKILIAIPTECGVHERTSAATAKLAARPDTDYITAVGRPVDFVRNSLIRIFLKYSDYSHLFLLDSDTEPPLDAIERLLALNVPLATGCYPLIMTNGLRWALANKDSVSPVSPTVLLRKNEAVGGGVYRLLEWLPSLDKPFEVDAGGAGCLLIRRDVFDKVNWPWFKWVEFEDGRQESEDIFFFRKCNDAGLRVAVDPQVICNHFKKTNITDLMRMKMRSPALRDGVPHVVISSKSVGEKSVKSVV